MFHLARATRVSVVTPTRLSRGSISRSLPSAGTEGDAPAVPKRPHVDGRRQFSDIPDGMETVGRVVTDEKIAAFRASIANELVLAPLTKGGTLPFRRLCVDLGCNVTVSEMVFARYALKRNPVELARLRRHESEKTFGVQIATNQIAEGVNAGRLAFESGADFLDLNCGCPINETWKRGLGAKLLKKPAKLERLVRGIADGVPLPLTVKIRLGAGSSETPAAALAEAVQNAGAAAVIVHGRTKEQRYTRAANWNLIGEIRAKSTIPVVGNGDILTWYEHRNRLEQSGAFATMTGRGALIKPWIFKEKIDGAEWDPTPEARIGVYLKLCGYFKEHFRADDLGKKRYMEFMPWHFGFFCRYRPLPETVYGAMAREHPLLQTRLGVVESAAIAAAEAKDLSPLDRLLRVELEECHARLSEALWDADSDVGRAVELFEVMTTDGSLERWEAEECAMRARRRDPDASLGAGEAVRG